MKLVWYFKKWPFLVSAILGIFVIISIYIVFSGFNLIELNLIIAYLSSCVWILFCGNFFRHQLNNYLRKLTNILINDCDPEKFIRAWLPLIKINKHSKVANNVNAFLFLSLSTGYVEAGKEEEAFSTLENINDFPNNRYGDNLL